LKADALGDRVSVKFGQRAPRDKNLQDCDQQVRTLLKSGQLKGGELVRIKGENNAHTAINIGAAFAEDYEAIALFCNEKGFECFLVCHAKATSRYKVNDRLPDW
jgi:hypothetical protein